VTILDLNEVGEFFISKMANKELDLQHLLLVGFDFLSQYFLSANEKTQKLIKSQAKKKESDNKASSMYAYGYGPVMPGYFDMASIPTKKTEEDGNATTNTVFKLVKPPSEMEHLDIIWSIALQCQNK